MEKVLYEATVEIHIYVMAESEGDARKIASQNISNEVGNLSHWDYDITREPEYCYSEWENEDPYNSDNAQTVGELTKEIHGRKEFLRKQGNLFPPPEKGERG